MYVYKHKLFKNVISKLKNEMLSVRKGYFSPAPQEILLIANKCPRSGTSLTSLLTKALFYSRLWVIWKKQWFWNLP